MGIFKKKSKEEKKKKKEDRKKKRSDRKDKRKEKFRMARLKPFKGMMLKALKRKGIAAGNKSLEQIAVLFHDHVIHGKQHVEFTGTENLTDVAAETIVKTIFEFIKKIKELKDSGKNLSDNEKQILDDSEEAAKHADKNDKDDDDDKPRKKRFSFRSFFAFFGIHANE